MQYRKFYKSPTFINNMEESNVIISREEFNEYQILKQKLQSDKEVLVDVALGIKDVLQGNVEEI